MKNVFISLLILLILVLSYDETAQAAFVASYESSSPSIDGVLSDGEWSNGNEYDVTLIHYDGVTTHEATLYFMHDETSLFIGVDSGWGSGWDVMWDCDIDGDYSRTLNGNLSQPYTDVQVSQQSPTGWSGYRAYRTLPDVNEEVRVGFGSGADCASSGSTNVFYEFKIPLADLGAEAGDSIGLYCHQGDTGEGKYNDYHWPDAQKSEPSQWATLTIAPMTLLSPNGGEELITGNSYTIEWESIEDVNDVNIVYSDSNGFNWNTIDPNTENDGEYDWEVPEVTSNQCLVRISDVNDANIYDTSDDAFTIYVCQLSSLGQDADLDDNCKVDFADFSIWSQQWLNNGNPFDANFTEIPDGPEDMVWINIDEPNFTGQMSKYETTNTQYCEYLNSALASGDIYVDSNTVYGVDGNNPGEDFIDEIYFETYAADSHSQITYSDGSFSVRTRDGNDMSNHPVVEVSWYGATAFCNYYGFRLPTEWEWQAVADYDGSYIYGCGTNISHSKANYDNYNPLGLSSEPYTSPVGYYPAYGYGMCDMAGNVWEWTSTVSDTSHILRGGGWNNDESNCTVSSQNPFHPDHCKLGFRVCR